MERSRRPVVLATDEVASLVEYTCQILAKQYLNSHWKHCRRLSAAQKNLSHEVSVCHTKK